MVGAWKNGNFLEDSVFRTVRSHNRLGMSDVQNFFHEALAVIIAKLQYLYTRRKLSVSSIERYHFPVERSMCV